MGGAIGTDAGALLLRHCDRAIGLFDRVASCFIDCRTPVEARIFLDLDATDDPVQGTQEGRFHHGYYKSYCQLPLYIACGRHLLAAKLRAANIDGAAGALEEVARIIAQIRERWPRVGIPGLGSCGAPTRALRAKT